jgi:hypothetical protein
LRSLNFFPWNLSFWWLLLFLLLFLYLLFFILSWSFYPAM